MLIRKEGVLVNENIDKVLEIVINENVASDFDKIPPSIYYGNKKRKWTSWRRGLQWNATSRDPMVFECLFEVSR